MEIIDIPLRKPRTLVSKFRSPSSCSSSSTSSRVHDQYSWLIGLPQLQAYQEQVTSVALDGVFTLLRWAACWVPTDISTVRTRQNVLDGFSMDLAWITRLQQASPSVMLE